MMFNFDLMDYEHLKYIEMDKRIRCSWSDTNNNQCERAGIRDGLCLYHFNNLKYIEMDTKQKELWRIAQEAYMSASDAHDQDWKAVANAIITEHERRKAELVKPDPFAIEKAAFAEGKRIQFYSQSCSEWLDCNPSPPSWYPDFKYRVKPEPVQVELGPDDVPPGSFIKTQGLLAQPWIAVLGVDSGGVQFVWDRVIRRANWDALYDAWLINRNDGKGWVPCSKIKPELFQ